MRVVIDTNSLQTDELRMFLNADPSNLAILPEHTIGEIFKPKRLDAVYASFEILRDYPLQIRQLLSNKAVAATNVSFPGFANRFIDRDASRQMPSFIEILKRTAAGDKTYLDAFDKRRKWAFERSDRAIAAFGDISDQLAAMRLQFDPLDLAKLSKGERTSLQFKLLLLRLTDAIATDIWRRLAHPRNSRHTSKHNDFTWRYVLSHLLQLLRLSASGALRRKPARAVNDHMDNVFATYGTYFNGLMTNDAEANETHIVARVMLENIGVQVPPDYIGSGYMHTVLDQLDATQSS